MINLSFNFDNIEDLQSFMKRIAPQEKENPPVEKPKKEKKTTPAIAATPTSENNVPIETETVDFGLGGGDDLDNLLGGAAKTLTVEDLRDRASEVAGKSENHKKQVIALIQSHKVGAISDIKPEHFQSFMDKVNAIK